MTEKTEVRREEGFTLVDVVAVYRNWCSYMRGIGCLSERWRGYGKQVWLEDKSQGKIYSCKNILELMDSNVGAGGRFRIKVEGIDEEAEKVALEIYYALTEKVALEIYYALTKESDSEFYRRKLEEKFGRKL